MDLSAPLVFRPKYRKLVWGGRRLERWRADLPAGPVGESWDLADHEDGMSEVAAGPLAGRSLRELVASAPAALVGRGFGGQAFPLMVKLIDARETLSVQVHPDDELARRLRVGDNGKTECWLVLEDGGTIYQGTRPGVDRAAFEAALQAGEVAGTLNQFAPSAGDFYFLEARTVHALGAGCLVCEIQQTSNVTFRVWDWGRMGLDGKPRETHVAQALETIAFDRSGFGPRRPVWEPRPGGGEARRLVDCPYFQVEEWRGTRLPAEGEDRCAVVVALQSELTLRAAGGAVALPAMHTALIPAAAGAWTAESTSGAHVLVARPRLA